MKIIFYMYMLKKYIKLFGGLTPPTPFVTSIEADFACYAYSKHTCKVHECSSRELVHFKKCFSSFSSNTPGRHCRKKTKKLLFETYKLTIWSVHVLCNCVYSTHYRQSLPRLTSRTAPSRVGVYS